MLVLSVSCATTEVTTNGCEWVDPIYVSSRELIQLTPEVIQTIKDALNPVGITYPDDLPIITHETKADILELDTNWFNNCQ